MAPRVKRCKRLEVHRMKKAVFLSDAVASIERVYAQGRSDNLRAKVDLYPHVVGRANWAEHVDNLRDVEVAFSTWGMPPLDGEHLRALPSLRAVFYAAGSVQAFARPFLQRDIAVVSAWAANAVPVAEFTLSQILLSCKGYFRNARACRDPEVRHAGTAFRGAGVFGETVGLIGIGMIGRTLCQLLRPFDLHVIGHDPYLDAQTAADLGVEMVSLPDLFARAYVVSNHLPNIPATVGLLDGPLFSTLRANATFINTGRGAQVVETDLINVLRERPDLTALLDVTLPEPPVKESPLYVLPNVQLSSHIAGSLNDEVVRMADYVLAEFERWEQGEELRYAVTEQMLETMA